MGTTPFGRLRRHRLAVSASIASAAIATALTWPSIVWAVGGGLALVGTLTVVLTMTGPRPRTGDPRPGREQRSDLRTAREVLDQLPFGVLVFDRHTRRCTYRNRLGSRWGAARSDETSGGVPWDPGHLAEVVTKLQSGAFTEPLPRDALSDSPPAEVRWEAIEGRLLATVRDLSDEEEQRMVLDDLHLDAVAEGGEPPQQVMIEALCREVDEPADDPSEPPHARGERRARSGAPARGRARR